MAASLAGLSASVTRILFLTGFPRELKTKDIQAAFSEWEAVNGGFKIKWRDDTSLLIVFRDASIAERAYLHTIAFLLPILTSSTTGTSATIRPYDGPYAQNVIQTVNSRGQHKALNPSRGRSNSISVFPGVSPISTRPSSGSISRGGPPNFHPNMAQHVSIPIPEHMNGREPSSLGEAVGHNGSPPSDPAILASNMHPDMLAGGGPRIGDPGKRMLGAALGVRHPALGPRNISGGSPGTSPSQGGGVDQAMREVQRAMNGLVMAE
ncbi:hypothetical protein B0H13DRAFT_1853641 [Mycena leptocephala]|nr:hypothetical protein B0H13DRAFT_1853641 [Mycena leptocephala]